MFHISSGKILFNNVDSTIDSLNKEKTLIIGAGEIGKSLKNILSNTFHVLMRDKKEDDNANTHWYRVINICYPYSNQFIEITKEYIAKYKPELTIVHSTVPPGTIEKLGKGIVHSPVNGRHPDLEEGIKNFVKVVGGNDIFAVYHAVKYLNAAGIQTQVFSNARTSELSKILCTTYYGWNLVFMKEVARLCEQYAVPFQEVYTEWNTIYNTGYSQLKEFRFMRPILYPVAGEIGGHCVVPNCELLEDFLTKVVKERNQLYKDDGKIKEAPGQGPGSSMTEDRSLKQSDKPKRENRKRNKSLESGTK